MKTYKAILTKSEEVEFNAENITDAVNKAEGLASLKSMSLGEVFDGKEDVKYKVIIKAE